MPAPALQEVKPQSQYLVEELKDEITRLTGRIEDLERQQKEFEKESSHEQVKESFHKLEVRVGQLEKGQESIQESLHHAEEVAQSHQDPNELLKDAKASFNQGKYQEAADQLAKYQKTPKVKGLDEAAFLRGESFFHLKQYKKAIVEYSKFPEKFSHSVHLPEALYKIGLSFDLMGMKEDAKGFYQEVVEKFPKSTHAKNARKKLK